jgi:hypothetical protein
MNIAELDRLFPQVARKIVSAEITGGPGPLPHGVFEQAPRVIATLDDGSRISEAVRSIGALRAVSRLA